MAKNFNRSTYGSTSILYTEGSNCGDRIDLILPGDNRLIRNEYRSAPNGVWPFYAPTSMAAGTSSRSDSEQYQRWQGTSQYIAKSSGIPVDGVPNDSASGIAESRDIASREAFDRLYAQLTDCDISETLAQAKSAKQTVNIAEQIAYMTRKAAGRFGITRVISAGYMWSNWGVKPLVNDMYALMERSSREVQKPFTIKAGSTKTFKVSPLSNPINFGSGKYTYRVQATFKTGAFSGLSSITSMDPAYIAWTALPWTFITDYFYNIGGYLRQMELQALYNTAFLHGCGSEKIELDGLLTSGYPVNTGYSCYSNFIQFTQEQITHRSYARGVMLSLPAPKPPVFTLDCGSSQLLNIAASLGSFLGNGKPGRYS